MGSKNKRSGGTARGRPATGRPLESRADARRGQGQPGRSGGEAASRAPRADQRRTLLIAAALALAVLVVYSPTFHFGYVDYDDDRGLFKNPMVYAGLTSAGIGWALTTFHLGNWIPITWFSHMLDFTLFGPQPGWHHLVNVLIHVANTLVLFFLLLRLGRAAWASAAVAALFALHPLRVESVAWLIERKDVLSALAWLVAIWLYVSYVESGRSWGRYLAVVAVFTVGLAIKPMLVTLPFVLVLLDVWPLGRIALPWWGEPDASSGAGESVWDVLREKLPLVAIAAAWSVLTVVAQHGGGAVRTLAQVPLSTRLANAIVAYCGYVAKSLWPSGLAVFYPYRLDLPFWEVLAATAFLIAATAGALFAARAYPFVTVGWLWFLGTLVPVIGLVQVGSSAMADRYTYIPSIGLALLVVELPLALTAHRPSLRPALGVAAGLLALVLAVLSWNQVQYWRNSAALFERALAVTKDNAVAHYNLATAFAQEGKIDDAIAHYRETLRLDPNFADANQNLGLALFNQEKTEEAIEHYRAELRRNPDHPEALCHLGVALAVQGKLPEALAELLHAARVKPDYADAQYDLGMVYERLGRIDGAIAAYSRALQLAPDNADAHFNLAALLAERGRLDEAEALLTRLLQIQPSYPGASDELSAVRARRRR